MKLKTVMWDGKPISKPGMVAGVPMSAYHHPDICVGPSISSSGLRAIYGENTSPRHFYSQWAGNPKRTIKPDPRHFIVGRALHHLLLGEAFFDKLFCIQPDEWPELDGEIKPWNNNRKVCKKWNRERIAEGRSPLTPKEAFLIENMAISVGNHPLVQEGALGGLIERSYFWQDKETGIWLKWRPDATPADSADFVDLKTTRDIHYGSLSKTMESFSYYRQGALGQVACREVLDMDMSSFTLIFVEKKEPWTTRDVRCTTQDFELGRRENRAAVRLFAKCLKDGRWPGPGEGNEGNEIVGLSPAAVERRTKALACEGLPDGQD